VHNLLSIALAAPGRVSRYIVFSDVSCAGFLKGASFPGALSPSSGSGFSLRFLSILSEKTEMTRV
jgi:hypothetical protein